MVACLDESRKFYHYKLDYMGKKVHCLSQREIVLLQYLFFLYITIFISFHYCCWQEGSAVFFCIAAERRKPQTDHTPLFQHNVMKKMVSFVLYVHQLVQYLCFYRGTRAVPSAELAFFNSLFSLFESLAFIMLL